MVIKRHILTANPNGTDEFDIIEELKSYKVDPSRCSYYYGVTQISTLYYQSK